jgi:hypothetical protein
MPVPQKTSDGLGHVPIENGSFPHQAAVKRAEKIRTWISWHSIEIVIPEIPFGTFIHTTPNELPITSSSRAYQHVFLLNV